VSSFYPLNQQLVDAVFLTDTDDVQALLSQNADPDARDDENRTVLSVAVADGSSELVRLLLEAGADPNLPDDDGLTALDIAIYRRRLDLAWLLVNFGAGTKGVASESTLWRASLVALEDPGIHALVARTLAKGRTEQHAEAATN
jgi:ankyrin repeat protein